MLWRISPDTRWLVTGSEDKTAWLWDLRAKDLAANPVVLRGHLHPVYAVAISADNRWVVTGSKDKTARLWLLQIEDSIDLARITVWRNLSTDEWRLYFPDAKSVTERRAVLGRRRRGRGSESIPRLIAATVA